MDGLPGETGLTGPPGRSGMFKKFKTNVDLVKFINLY